MGSLLVLQGTNYVIPLITLPYLVRVLGAEGYGAMAFAQAFAWYFVILTDYGFNLTATRAVAIHRGAHARLSEIFSTVLTAKVILLIPSLLVLLLSISLVPPLRDQWPIQLAAFLIVLGNILFPTWLFQGLERMGYVTAISALSKGLGVIAIFSLVRSDQDVLLATLLHASGFLIAGLAGVTIALTSGLASLRIPRIAAVRSTLREGWDVFVSQASVTLFGNTNIFILGLFAPAAVVGHFAVAEKVVRAVIGLSVPVTSAVYPRVSTLFQSSREVALVLLRRITLMGGIVFSAASLGLLFGSESLVRLVVGEDVAAIALLIKVMAVLPLTIFIDNIYGTQILLNIGQGRRFREVTVVAGLFSVTASLMVVPTLGALGSALVLTATQLLVLGLLVRSVHHAGIRLHHAYP
jgi:polysaccharide transporter, PST family